MPKYCDSKALERNWFHWIISSQSPDLEPIRKKSALWTKVMGYAKKDDGTNIIRNGKPLPDPSFPARSHCIPLANPVYFTTCNGVLQAYCIVVKSDRRTICKSQEIYDLKSYKQAIMDEQLISYGYFKEYPVEESWCNLMIDINNICHGVANKFHQPTEEEKTELAHEALIQITNKLVNGKLTYTPGRASVFNLLTTAIYRCTYSIMNKRNNRKRRINELLADATNGALITRNRSLRAACMRVHH